MEGNGVSRLSGIGKGGGSPLQRLGQSAIGLSGVFVIICKNKRFAVPTECQRGAEKRIRPRSQRARREGIAPRRFRRSGTEASVSRRNGQFVPDAISAAFRPALIGGEAPLGRPEKIRRRFFLPPAHAAFPVDSP